MSDEVLVGKLVADRYRVVRRLGAGGMGTVYVAVQEPLGREVALKVVRRELAGEKRTLERFRREAKSLSTAHHPHIVTLYDFGELPSGALWFAMELVRGEDLRQRIAREGPVPVRKTVAIVRDAASALAAAHAMGIIHRDLKPENILLMEAAGRPDFVKLVDFGVAKLPIEPDADPVEQHLTLRGMVVGTPGYIAPEVALHDVSNDPRSDLYALGVVWFECLAGHPPFRARTATALMMLHATEPVPPLPAEVPLPIAGLVQRLLAKHPNDRPASAEALLTALDALPPFDSAVGVPRPWMPVVGADPSAATMDDSGNARTAPGGPPLSSDVDPRLASNLPTGTGGAPGAGGTAGWGVSGFVTANGETSARTLPAAVPSALPSALTVERAAAVTEGVLERPPPAPSRLPLIAAGVVLALATAAIGYVVTRPSAVGQASLPAALTDAGALSVSSAAPPAPLGDAGVVNITKIVDAGTKKIKVKRPRDKTSGNDGEYVPDLD